MINTSITVGARSVQASGSLVYNPADGMLSLHLQGFRLNFKFEQGDLAAKIDSDAMNGTVTIKTPPGGSLPTIATFENALKDQHGKPMSLVVGFAVMPNGLIDLSYTIY